MLRSRAPQGARRSRLHARRGGRPGSAFGVRPVVEVRCVPHWGSDGAGVQGSSAREPEWAKEVAASVGLDR